MVKVEFEISSDEYIPDVILALDDYVSCSYSNLKITDGTTKEEYSTDMDDYYQSSTEWDSSSC